MPHSNDLFLKLHRQQIHLAVAVLSNTYHRREDGLRRSRPDIEVRDEEEAFRVVDKEEEGEWQSSVAENHLKVK
jgi:hypothetical protein